MTTCFKKYICVLLVAVLTVFSFSSCSKENTIEKTVQITVDYGNGTSDSYTFSTEREILADLLNDENLIESQKGEYGLFITAVNGIKADEGKEQWWKITRNGEMLLTGISSTKLMENDKFELTLTTGYTK